MHESIGVDLAVSVAVDACLRKWHSSGSESVKGVTKLQKPTVVQSRSALEDFMDSSGLGAIVACFKLTGQKGDFVLCNMNEAVTEIFALTHMDSLFDIYPDADEGFQKMCA